MLFVHSQLSFSQPLAASLAQGCSLGWWGSIAAFLTEDDKTTYALVPSIQEDLDHNLWERSWEII